MFKKSDLNKDLLPLIYDRSNFERTLSFNYADMEVAQLQVIFVGIIYYCVRVLNRKLYSRSCTSTVLSYCRSSTWTAST